MTQIGDVLVGKYRLERLIGSGGFAAVYAATNVLIDRTVALKILHSSVAQSEVVVERFLREARLASKNIHPTIVRVEDIGKNDQGEPFLIMELLEGRTLAEEVEAEGALPLSRVINISTLMLEGLAAAHSHGIIHRDFKPANIFLVRPGFPDPPVRILDLGMAKDLRDQHLLTVSGDVIGTPSYLAPEILLNPSDTLWVPALDVFSMGMMMFYMLTGRLPFDQGDATGYMAVLHRMDYYKSITHLQGPAELAPHVPPAVDVVVRRALSIPPEGRYQNAREMLIAFNQAKTRIGPTLLPSTDDLNVEELVELEAEDPEEATQQWNSSELLEAMRRMGAAAPEDHVEKQLMAMKRGGAPPPGAAPPPAAPVAQEEPPPEVPRSAPSAVAVPAGGQPMAVVEVYRARTPQGQDVGPPLQPPAAKPSKRGSVRTPGFRLFLAVSVICVLLVLMPVPLLAAIGLDLIQVHPLIPWLLLGWIGISVTLFALNVTLWVIHRRGG